MRRVDRLAAAWARHWPALAVAAFALAALLPATARLVQTASPAARSAASSQPHEFPREWDGRALVPLAASRVEQRFAASFPGSIGRFSDGERVFVLREVNAPTRMLHPAADCFRGLGWRIGAAQLERDAQTRLWRCFSATRDGEGLRVCERIEGSDGSSFTDASAWFWAASFATSAGPWQAVTIVEAL